MFTLHNGDCLPYMRSLPADSVDAVITDPPYGMGLFEHDVEQWEVVKDIYRLMKPNSIIYMFCGDNSY
jgi:DNA modification methylase